MLELEELLSGISGCAPRVLRAGPSSFTRLGHDSRNLVGGELFAALRSATGDGHGYLGDAVAMGAAGVLVERPLAELEVTAEGPITEVMVDDVRSALQAWAAHRVHRTRMVAVTGTLGKSTTRAALRAAWGAAAGGPVFGNGDRNDSLGLPIALSEANGPPLRAVLEVVGDGTQEEERLSRMLRPEVAVLTSALDATALYWRSAAGVLASVRRMWPAPTVLVLPEGSRGTGGQPAVRFGPLGSGAEVTAGPSPGASGVGWPERWECLILADGRRWRVPTQLHPRLAATAFAASAACLLVLGADLDRGVGALAEVAPLPGRLRPIPAGGGTLLDDSFDATPASTRVALGALAGMPAPRLAVVGGIRGQYGRPMPVPAAVELLSLAHHPAPPPGEVQRRVSQVLAAGGSVLVKGRAESRLERLVAGLAPPGTPVVRPEPGRRGTPFRSLQRPTWVEIDLGALAANVAEVVAELGPVGLMAVVKADAYGHGAVQVARTAIAAGASWVATATVAEAAELRRAGIAAPCLVLGYTPPVQAEQAVRLGLVLTVFDREVLDALAVAGERTGMRAVAHIKVDSGMSRLGIGPADVADLVRASRPPVELQGAYTHLRKGEDPGATADQLAMFGAALAAAEAAGHRFQLRHVASSASWRGVAGSRFDLARVGGELLGLRTADGRVRRPVLSFKTTVAQVRVIGAGAYVGYGDAFRAAAPTRIATLPVGYGDGFRRGPRAWGSVLIRGREHPLAGDVCMDMAMVDVSSDPAVARGDEVVLIGVQGATTLSAEAVAERLGVLNYELVSQILPRVPREPRGGL